jgi:ATP-dependent Clp protease, protease subunit
MSMACSSAPKVLIEDAKETKAVDLGSCLLQQRKVYLGEEVDSDSSNAVVQQLLYLEHQDAKAPITLYLNTPGGSIVDGMAVYDLMQQVSCPVHVVVVGMAASMGSVLLSGGEKGHRYILPHGEVLLHQPLGGARGPATDIKISAQRIIKTKEMLLRLLADNCGQTYERLVEDCDRDYWLDADAAVEYGICDQVLNPS